MTGALDACLNYIQLMNFKVKVPKTGQFVATLNVNLLVYLNIIQSVSNGYICDHFSYFNTTLLQFSVFVHWLTCAATFSIANNYLIN